MAGQYFYDPRPFYGINGHSGLLPLDEVNITYAYPSTILSNLFDVSSDTARLISEIRLA